MNSQRADASSAGSESEALINAAVSRHDDERLQLPPPLSVGQELGICAIGYGWLELTTEPQAPVLPRGLTLNQRRQCWLPAGYLRLRFGPTTGRPLLCLVRHQAGQLWALVADAAYADAALSRGAVPPLSFVAASGSATPWSTPVAVRQGSREPGSGGP